MNAYDTIFKNHAIFPAPDPAQDQWYGELVSRSNAGQISDIEFVAAAEAGRSAATKAGDDVLAQNEAANVAIAKVLGHA